MKPSSTATDAAPLRLGIVGCGGIVRGSHLPAILALPSAAKVAVLCDATLRSAELAKAEFALNVPVTAKAADLKGAVDAAIVAVPPRFHAPVTIELLKLGIHVLCEKPLATATADGRQMVETAEQTGQVLAVGFQQRFHPNNQLLRDVLASDWLGEVQEVIGEFGGAMDGFLGAPTYFSRATTIGGVLFDMGIHFVDRVLWLFGDLGDVTLDDDSYGGMEANAILRGRLGQVPCTLAFSWTHGLNNSILVRGSKASVEIRLAEPTRARLQCDIAGHKRTLTLEADSVPANFNPSVAQMQDFINAVRARRPPLVTGRSALRSLEVVEEAYRVRRRLPQPWVDA